MQMPMPIFDAARHAILGAEVQPHRGEQRPSVLIVDPDPRCQDFCRQILGEAGFEVGQAAGSAEAQDLIEQRPPDVILVDAAACHGDVRAWAHCLKASPSTRDVPLILIAPADNPAEATADLDAGVDDCIETVSCCCAFARPRGFGNIAGRSSPCGSCAGSRLGCGACFWTSRARWPE